LLDFFFFGKKKTILIDQSLNLSELGTDGVARNTETPLASAWTAASAATRKRGDAGKPKKIVLQESAGMAPVGATKSIPRTGLVATRMRGDNVQGNGASAVAQKDAVDRGGITVRRKTVSRGIVCLMWGTKPRRGSYNLGWLGFGRVPSV